MDSWATIPFSSRTDVLKSVVKRPLEVPQTISRVLPSQINFHDKKETLLLFYFHLCVSVQNILPKTICYAGRVILMQMEYMLVWNIPMFSET